MRGRGGNLGNVEACSEQLPEAPFFINPPNLEPRYRNIELVRVRRSVSIYRATQAPLGRDVTLRVLHAGREALDQARRKEFLREAMILSELRHPNLAAIHDFGETTAEALFVVSEYLEGSPLSECLDGSPLEFPRMLNFAFQVAVAFEAAHDEGMPHVDIDPENILVLRMDDAERETIKVLDFGLTEQVAIDSAPGDLPVRFANGLMAPERLQGARASAESEVYAFGALVFMMCTGRTPRSVDRSIHAEPAIPPDLAEILGRCVAASPKERFGSMFEVTEALQTWFEDHYGPTGEHPTPRGDSAPPRARQEPTEEAVPVVPSVRARSAGVVSMWGEAPSVKVRSSRWIVGLVLLAVAAAGLTAWVMLGPPASPRTVSVEVPLPRPAPEPSEAVPSVDSTPAPARESAREAPVPPPPVSARSRALDADPPKKRVRRTTTKTPARQKKARTERRVVPSSDEGQPALLPEGDVPSVGMVGEASAPQIGLIDED